MENIHFANSVWLYSLLVALPLAAAFWYASFRFRRKAREHYGEDKLVDRYTRKPKLFSELLQLTAWSVIVTLLVVAAAGPVMPDAPQRAQTGSLQVVVVMDVSWSMSAEDYRSSMPGPNGEDGALVVGPHGSRLGMTKYVIKTKIMQAIPGNQIGIVTYMGNGFPQADLTDDYTALRFVLDNWIKSGSAPGGGSDYAEGLKEALETFKRDEDPNRQKVIVLFSDGGFTGDQAELAKVSQQIVEKGIRLIIIGVGMPNGITIPVYDSEGKLTGYKEKDGKTVTTSLEEAPLTQLEAATGGQYIHMTNDKDFQVQWVSTLAGSKVEPHETHVYQYPLSAALVILFVLSFRGLARRRDTL